MPLLYGGVMNSDKPSLIAQVLKTNPLDEFDGPVPYAALQAVAEAHREEATEEVHTTPYRDFVRLEDGTWTCNEQPVEVDFHALGIPDLHLTDTPFKLTVEQDEEDSLVVTVVRGKITDAVIESKGTNVTLAGFTVSADNYAAPFFLTGAPTTRAAMAMKLREENNGEMAMGYIPYQNNNEEEEGQELV